MEDPSRPRWARGARPPQDMRSQHRRVRPWPRPFRGLPTSSSNPRLCLARAVPRCPIRPRHPRAGWIFDHSAQRFEDMLGRVREIRTLELFEAVERELAEYAVQPGELKLSSPVARVRCENRLVLLARVGDAPVSPGVGSTIVWCHLRPDFLIQLQASQRRS